MAVLNPRNKTVIFRLTEDEYSALQEACTSRGARSLSDYARERILSMNEGPPIEQTLYQLNSAVQQLTRMLEKP